MTKKIGKIEATNISYMNETNTNILIQILHYNGVL